MSIDRGRREIRQAEDVRYSVPNARVPEEDRAHPTRDQLTREGPNTGAPYRLVPILRCRMSQAEVGDIALPRLEARRNAGSSQMRGQREGTARTGALLRRRGGRRGMERRSNTICIGRSRHSITRDCLRAEDIHRAVYLTPDGAAEDGVGHIPCNNLHTDRD